MTDNIFLADTHVHSMFSQDSESALSDIYKAAQEKKIDVVCITDHADVKPTSDMERIVQNRKNILRAIEEERSKGADLLLGIELACGGFYPDNSIFQRAEQMLLSIGQYDCVIGSVHSVGATSTARNDYMAMSKQELIDYLARYFDAVLAMLEYGNPDILAHLTYPLRYINGKYKKDLDWRTLETKIREIFTRIIQKGVALEINTSNLGSGYDYLMPEEDMIKLYLQMGGRLLTLGSDAHKPENVGKGFVPTIQKLKQWNVEELYYVKNRKFHAYQI